MVPVIDKRKTGVHLRQLMDERGLSVKDVQQYLGLGSVQSVYHWLNGSSLPNVDNLYILSALFQIPVDDMICGNREEFYSKESRGNTVNSNRKNYAYQQDDIIRTSEYQREISQKMRIFSYYIALNRYVERAKQKNV